MCCTVWCRSLNKLHGSHSRPFKAGLVDYRYLVSPLKTAMHICQYHRPLVVSHSFQCRLKCYSTKRVGVYQGCLHDNQKLAWQNCMITCPVLNQVSVQVGYENRFAVCKCWQRQNCSHDIYERTAKSLKEVGLHVIPFHTMLLKTKTWWMLDSTEGRS